MHGGDCEDRCDSYCAKVIIARGSDLDRNWLYSALATLEAKKKKITTVHSKIRYIANVVKCQLHGNFAKMMVVTEF